MPSRWWGSGIRGHSGACGAALSKRFEKSEELVVRTVSCGLGRGGGDACERLFLEAQIGVDVDLRRFDGFMPEPERDDRLVDAMVQQLHRGTVSKHVRAHPFSDQRRTHA